MPQNKKAINGFLFAGYKRDNSVVPKYNYNLHGVFSEKKCNIMPAVDRINFSLQAYWQGIDSSISVGKITYNGSTIVQQQLQEPKVMYTYTSPYIYTGVDEKVVWATEGIGSFKAINPTLPRSYPVLSNSFAPPPIVLNSSYSINTSSIASNYDSIRVTIADGYSSADVISKVISKEQGPIISFTKNEINKLVPVYWANGRMYFYVYNYANVTIENKIYLFELAGTGSKTVSIIH